MCVNTAELYQRHRDDMRKNLRFNFLAHGIEGGLFTGAIAFVDQTIVLPEAVHSLGGPGWLIAATPLLMIIAFNAPTIFTSIWIERLPKMHPFVLVTGFFQRIVFFIAGMILVFLAKENPLLGLLAVALTPLISGFLGGIGMTAWQEFVAKTIPENKRSSLWAFRNIFGAAMGVVAAKVIQWTLAAHPGAVGFGILHLIAFGVMMASWIVFSLIRETNLPPQNTAPRIDWSKYWSQLAGMVRKDRNLRLFLYTRLLASTPFICLPFLSIHTLKTLDQPQEFLGWLILMSTLGGVAGNIVGGVIGDYAGGKTVMVVSTAGFLIMCLASGLVVEQWQFMALFVLMGVAGSMQAVSSMTLSMELAPMHQRISYLATMSFTGLIGSLVVVPVTAVLKEMGWSYFQLSIVASIGIALMLIIMMRIKEPRTSVPPFQVS
ncbi:MFS transporter [Candidatus Sumerlaeota bacterium]|nr:MFS transporter [Candidatus Sumerlaeota bacterium]